MSCKFKNRLHSLLSDSLVSCILVH